ncbi:uncharacterized protein LOC132791906 [Drosophila nasuta]|uniref:uncharacterized protein LOC132791906 n=1 Tax=Drosophila nasuta TaxID=42062 RepID=UPI00295EE2D8|nr:uncharacterized protein LOC132791906 [Drosophila nasuta]
MVSSRSLNKLLMSAALLIAGCSLVFSYPSGTEDNEGMLNDDYEYDDASNVPSPQTKPAKDIGPQQNISVTVTGILGEEVVLKCDTKIGKDTVINWYRGEKIISTGTNLVQPNFSLNPSNFDLTILNSSPQSAGDYYCTRYPSGSHTFIKLVLNEHSLDIITPESSKSSQSSIHGLAATLMWSLSAVFVAALQQYKH